MCLLNKRTQPLRLTPTTPTISQKHTSNRRIIKSRRNHGRSIGPRMKTGRGKYPPPTSIPSPNRAPSPFNSLKKLDRNPVKRSDSKPPPPVTLSQPTNWAISQLLHTFHLVSGMINYSRNKNPGIVLYTARNKNNNNNKKRERVAHLVRPNGRRAQQCRQCRLPDQANTTFSIKIVCN